MVTLSLGPNQIKEFLPTYHQQLYKSAWTKDKQYQKNLGMKRMDNFVFVLFDWHEVQTNVKIVIIR